MLVGRTATIAADSTVAAPGRDRSSKRHHLHVLPWLPAGGGFQAEVTVANNSTTALNGWTVGLTLASGQAISSLWSGTNTGTTGSVSVRNAAYNGTVGPNASTTFGFTAAATATAPSNVALHQPLNKATIGPGADRLRATSVVRGWPGQAPLAGRGRRRRGVAIQVRAPQPAHLRVVAE
ncbi:cellulose binding domain-containing protein [Micromonospora ureilytica]|uniref:cellulose binding domain-containing protein n=1 Tax=Micromonospora ureilytica TaxID=709868 RepID=UPI00340CDB50